MLGVEKQGLWVVLSDWNAYANVQKIFWKKTQHVFPHANIYSYPIPKMPILLCLHPH